MCRGDRSFSRAGFRGCSMSSSATSTGSGSTSPRASDVYEKDQNLVFETELPGVNKDEIQVKVDDDQLVISGEVKRREEIDRENYFRIGRRYGRFQRSFPLPADMVKKDGIKARFENGILIVTVPLIESIKKKEKPIEVKVE